MLDPKPFLRVLDSEAEVMKARGEHVAARGAAWALAGVAFLIAYVFAMVALQTYLAWHVGPAGAWAIVSAITAVVGGVVLLVAHNPQRKRRVQLAELQAQKAKLETEVELVQIQAQIEGLRRIAALPASEKAFMLASYLIRKLQER